MRVLTALFKAVNAFRNNQLLCLFPPAVRKRLVKGLRVAEIAVRSRAKVGDRDAAAFGRQFNPKSRQSLFQLFKYRDICLIHMPCSFQIAVIVYPFTPDAIILCFNCLEKRIDSRMTGVIVTTASPIRAFCFVPELLDILYRATFSVHSF